MSNVLQLRMGVEPHRNRYLFSDHYLEKILLDDPRWQQALTEAKQFCDWLRDLYADEKDHYGLVRAPEKEDLLHEVSTVLRRQTVLFMSYNLADPDFNLLWRAVRARAGRFARTAYAVWPSLPEGEVRIWRDRGIVVLNTDPLGV